MSFSDTAITPTLTAVKKVRIPAAIFSFRARWALMIAAFALDFRDFVVSLTFGRVRIFWAVSI